SRRCMCLSPGSRTHRGIEFCRPLRGLTSFVCASTPGTRTHRGLRFCRPLRGLTSFVCASPPVRGLTGGYGSVALCAGSRRLYVPLPRFADSPGATVLSPAARAHVVCMCLSPGTRTHRGLRFCRPLRGLTSFVCASPPVRGLTGG